MNDLAVIDHFLDVFSRYIDSGFGLLGGEVAFLTATLVVLDMTLAGLFWALGGDDVLGRLIKKVLYVGSFAFIIGNFNALAGIIFRSFAGLGLLASGSGLTQAQLLRPGWLAKTGVDAARPIFEQIGTLVGFPEVFLNLDSLAILGLAWLVVIVSFFILAVQLFVTMVEFKLTTLAGFVLVPFALWNKTSFLAEKVLGNVVSSGVKVLVLAVIVGIGSGLMAQFQTPPGAEPSIDRALAMMLASGSLLALGIFGPAIATGLVSGAPQLGAGAAAGAALGMAGVTVATGAAVVGAASAVAAGARMLPGTARSVATTTTLARRSTATAPGASVATPPGAGPRSATGAVKAARTEAKAAGAGSGSEGSGVGAVPSPVAPPVVTPSAPPTSAPPAPPAAPSQTVVAKASPEPVPDPSAPGWAQRLRTGSTASRAVSTATHVVRSSDHGGGGASPSLRDDSNS